MYAAKQKPIDLKNLLSRRGNRLTGKRAVV
jgi:hypothetical protein